MRKVWYIIESHGTDADGNSTAKVIRTEYTEKQDVIGEMLRMKQEDPDRTLVAGLAEWQLIGEPKEYEDITQMMI